MVASVNGVLGVHVQHNAEKELRRGFGPVTPLTLSVEENNVKTHQKENKSKNVRVNAQVIIHHDLFNNSVDSKNLYSGSAKISDLFLQIAVRFVTIGNTSKLSPIANELVTISSFDT